MLWDTGLSICVQFTPFRYRCMYKRKLSLYTRPFPLSSFARCSLLLVVLSPWFYLFVHQLRSAAAAVCDDFDRRILPLFFLYRKLYTNTHSDHPSYQCLLSLECYLNQIHTHTHSTLTDLAFRCFEKYGIKTPARLPVPIMFHPPVETCFPT